MENHYVYWKVPGARSFFTISTRQTVEIHAFLSSRSWNSIAESITARNLAGLPKTESRVDPYTQPYYTRVTPASKNMPIPTGREDACIEIHMNAFFPTGRKNKRVYSDYFLDAGELVSGRPETERFPDRFVFTTGRGTIEGTRNLKNAWIS